MARPISTRRHSMMAISGKRSVHRHAQLVAQHAHAPGLRIRIRHLEPLLAEQHVHCCERMCKPARGRAEHSRPAGRLGRRHLEGAVVDEDAHLVEADGAEGGVIRGELRREQRREWEGSEEPRGDQAQSEHAARLEGEL